MNAFAALWISIDSLFQSNKKINFYWLTCSSDQWILMTKCTTEKGLIRTVIHVTTILLLYIHSSKTTSFLSLWFSSIWWHEMHITPHDKKYRLQVKEIIVTEGPLWGECSADAWWSKGQILVFCSIQVVQFRNQIIIHGYLWDRTYSCVARSRWKKERKKKNQRHMASDDATWADHTIHIYLLEVKCKFH